MKSELAVFCIAVTVSACGSNPSDSAKLIELERRCTKQAMEKVTAKVKIDRIDIHHILFETPVGAAHLPVLDRVYSPIYVAERLLTEPNPIKEILYTYEVAPSAVTDTQCAGKFSIIATKPEEVQKQFPCAARRHSDMNSSGRYFVEYVYGSADDFDIRPFQFSVVDRETGKVLARQQSFQLLLGHMSKSETTTLLGWGSAQGAKTCNLTPPDIFIKQIMQI